MIGLILQQRALIVPLLLSAILFIIIIALVTLNFSYNKKIGTNEKQIQDIQMQLDSMEKIVAEEDDDAYEKIDGRALTPHQEIVPFINLLESLFAIIDKESKILVRDSENQILINRYADYEVTLNPGDKMDLFLKALNELQKSKYITKVTQFLINYVPNKGEGGNVIDVINLTIRLYFE